MTNYIVTKTEVPALKKETFTIQGDGSMLLVDTHTVPLSREPKPWGQTGMHVVIETRTTMIKREQWVGMPHGVHMLHDAQYVQ